MEKCNVESWVTMAPELEKVDNFLDQYCADSPAIIKEGLVYMLRAGGKRMRPAFVILASRYGNNRGWLRAAGAAELVHMVSLIHDDIIDSASLRRGKETLRNRYGDYDALQIGDYLFAKALALLEYYGDARLNQMLAAVSFNMCRAEIEQLVHEHTDRQSLKLYLSRIKKKTAQLISFSLQAGAIVSSARDDIVYKLELYGLYLGMAFQIADDLLDYAGDGKKSGKAACSDLQQGLVTLPLLYFHKIASYEKRRAVETLFSKNVLSSNEIAYIMQSVRESGALIFAQDIAAKYALKALRQLEGLTENTSTEILRQVAASFCRKGNKVV